VNPRQPTDDDDDEVIPDKRERVRLARNEREFDPQERMKIRELLDSWIASKKLWRMLGRIMTVVGGVIVFMWTMREPIARVIRALGGD
jgi:hypothetical protein